MKNKNTKEAFAPAENVGGIISDYCLKHGLILRPVGDAMCFCPPLIISDNEIDSLFDRYSQALDEGLDHLTKEGKAVA